MKDEINKEEQKAKLNISKKIYSMMAVKRTLTKYMEIVYVKISEDVENTIVEIELKDEFKEEKSNRKDILKVVKEIYNDILDEDVRLKVEEETKNIRELIYEKAMSKVK